jgi:hypothetical protein
MESCVNTNQVKVGLSQSNYIPWIGYFWLIANVDYFIFYDSVQFTKNDWRNRNKLLINDKPLWLSIPVGGSLTRSINQVKLPDGNWRKKHIMTFELNYKSHKYFEEIFDIFRNVLSDNTIETLSLINQTLIMKISQNLFCLNTVFANSTGLSMGGDPTDNVISQIQVFKPSIYFSGPSAQNYISEPKFIKNGIRIEYLEYSRCNAFQLEFGGNSKSSLSILDLISRVGVKSIRDFLVEK